MTDPSSPAAPAVAAPVAPGAAPPVNTLAIVALVLSFFVSIGGIICGHLALSQIRRTGESGREFALAGLIVGYVFTGLGVLAALASIVIVILYAVFFGVLLTTLDVSTV